MSRARWIVRCMVLVIASSVASSALADVVVFAAASLKGALDEQATRFSTATGTKVVVSYGASNALARQIEAGAPADVFVSADTDWMDDVDRKQLLMPGTRVNLLSNALVLIAPAHSDVALKIAREFPLAATLGDRRLAVANPDSVPAGKYARAALEYFGVWKSVERHVARAENVRAALALVARAEAPLGIVYATDAYADKGVRIVDAFPSASHPAIVYPAAVLTTSRAPAAPALLQYLRSAEARVTWQKYGFGVAEAP